MLHGSAIIHSTTHSTHDVIYHSTASCAAAMQTAQTRQPDLKIANLYLNNAETDLMDKMQD